MTIEPIYGQVNICGASSVAKLQICCIRLKVRSKELMDSLWKYFLFFKNSSSSIFEGFLYKVIK